MKKYTILSSDTEEEKRVERIGNRCIAATPIPLPHVERQPLCWDRVRIPSLKSEEEISYWITTAKPPCLYHYDIVGGPPSYAQQYVDYTPELKERSPVKSYLLHGKVYDVPTYVPNKQNPACQRFNNNLWSNKTNRETKPPLRGDNMFLEDFASDLYKKYDLNCLKRPGEQYSNEEMKAKISRNTQPLGEYDSDSSVLTINYIKYVNNKQADNMKQSKLRRQLTNSSAHFKDLENLSKDSGCALQDKDFNMIPLRSKNLAKCKKSCSRNSTLAPLSFEATKQLNMEIFENSKTSSSSIENCLNNVKGYFKHTPKTSLQLSDNPDTSKSLKNEHSTDQEYSYNVSSDWSKSATQMVYTKVETVQYVSESYSNNSQTKHKK